ncbi:hypothetical protein AAU61_10675 [Desulfocarbo indianensis]|nr:hypothetical protein AAU61_10675 [Desulfocarbo indianensis]
MHIYDPQEHNRLEPLWPHALVSRALSGVAALIVLVGLAFFGPELFMPLDRPPHEPLLASSYYPPWYLWPAAGLARLFPAGLAIALVAVFGAGLLTLPFWDKGERAYFWGRYVYSRLVLACLLVTAFLAFWRLW